uniref:ARAD1A04620p n=1 Tax=Blastobotrys adeninivorans TaxID=409370 RepID=A0A060SX03_BLAAD
MDVQKREDRSEDVQNAQPSGLRRVFRMLIMVLMFIPNLVAHYIIRPLGVMRHSTMGKLFVIVTVVYLIAAASLYMFTGQYHPFSKDLYNHLPFAKSDSSRFDPRAAPKAMLANPADVQVFDWNDWLDLSVIQKVAKNANETSKLWPFKWSGEDPFKGIQTPPRKAGTEEQNALIGKYFLSQKAPVPKAVYFLETDRVVNVVSQSEYDRLERQRVEKEQADQLAEEEKKNEDKEKRDDEKKDDKDDKEDKEDKEDKMNEEHEDKEEEKTEQAAAVTSTTSAHSAESTFDSLFPEFKSKDYADRMLVDMPLDLFKFDVDMITNVTEDMSKEDREHAEFINWAVDHVKDSPKYFYEVPLKNDHTALGVHYDWRFFNKIRRGTKHEEFMHHLMRAWSKFSEKENILSLIAHGSLIGYYWDGMAMPWDADNDVQMPIMELDRFARKYNQTLVVQDPKEGNGRYFIDVSPWYVDRPNGKVKTNNNNVIDARFIDIRSGIYIDITGLAYTDPKHGKDKGRTEVNCKSPHYYDIGELSPARMAMYEGVPVYVPNDVSKVLVSEYNEKIKKPKFNEWKFNQDLRLWVKQEKCAKFQIKKKKFDANGHLTKYGACNDDGIYEYYENTKEVTELRMREKELYAQLDALNKDDHAQAANIKAKLADLMKKYYPPLLDDPEPF